MATVSTAQQVRQWSGPALFSFGFRPFFLAGAVYAAVVIVAWVPWFLGLVALPTDWPPVAWHAHELLFGYVPAIMAGFLLTAVPNWTGRLPVVGWPLAGLVALWLAGRIAIATSAWLGPVATAIVTLSFLACLAAVIGREIVAGGNTRNLKVLVIVGALCAAEALFQWEVVHDGQSIYGARIAIAAVITLIVLIGGRIVPSFTGNWMRQRGAETLPTPFTRLDVVAIAAGVLALTAWIADPLLDGAGTGAATAALLLLAAILHVWRQVRWRPFATLAEPLVTILHAAYLFIPVGFLLASVAIVSDGRVPASAAVHAWTTGAIGAMTLAVMTRATLGHTGQKLTAGPATVAIYMLVVFAAGARIAAAFFPGGMYWLLMASGGAWAMAFAGFAVFFGPLLASRRRAKA